MTRFIQIRIYLPLRLAALLIAFLAINPSTLFAQNRDVDIDKDGLSDFHETFKHLTDPRNPDSDGDGIADGDWLERREYQYTIRSIVQVLRPVTPEYLNDDYQDARVLDETDSYFELEVIHYPFNKVAESISANENWRENTKVLGKWIEPGPSNDWTPEMQRELVAKLKATGINVDTLNDKQLVEQASRWLLDHAIHEDGFTSFVAAWDESGKPFVPDTLLDSAKRGMSQKNLEIKDQLEREVSAAGMFLLEIPERAIGTNGLGVTINLAARQGWLDLVRKHIAADPLSVHQRGWIGDTPLHWPAHNGYANIVEILLDSGADIEADEINCYGGKPLHWASEHAPDTVEVLLRRGANVNSRNTKIDSEFYGMTPLIMNATQNNDCAEVTRLLLDAGADIHAVDSKGKNALDYATEYGRNRIAAVLRNTL